VFLGRIVSLRFLNRLNQVKFKLLLTRKKKHPLKFFSEQF
jgi:hypothetical protein